MSEQSSNNGSSMNGASTPNFGSGLITVGADLIHEIQQVVGHSKVKALRVNLGNRHIKDIEVNPATAFAGILLAIAAVIISNLRVEVVKE